MDQDVSWPLGPLELRVLRTVWGRGRATVRDVLQAIAPEHPVAYTTVMTVMSRLADKGLLRRDLAGRTYGYSAAVSPAELASVVSRHMVNSLVDALGDVAITRFAAELDRVDQDRLRRLQEAAGRTKPPCEPSKSSSA